MHQGLAEQERECGESGGGRGERGERKALRHRTLCQAGAGAPCLSVSAAKQ